MVKSDSKDLESKVMSRMKEAVASFDQNHDEAHYQEIIQTALAGDYTADEISQFLTALHKQILTVVNQKYPRYFDGKLLKSLLTKEDGKRLGLVNQKTPDHTTMRNIYNLRDQTFAKNLGDLLCYYSDKSEFVVSNMGVFHLDGVEKILSNLSNKQLKIERLINSKDGDRLRIEELLGAHEQ